MNILLLLSINNTRIIFNRFSTKKFHNRNSILHVIRKVLQSETWSLSGGVHHWLKSSSTRQKKTFDEMMMIMMIIMIIIITKIITYFRVAIWCNEYDCVEAVLITLFNKWYHLPESFKYCRILFPSEQEFPYIWCGNIAQCAPQRSYVTYLYYRL
jgi:hypothetical protein